MTAIRFILHDRETGPTGEIVRFSVYEGESMEDLCFCGKLCMSAEKYDTMRFSLMLHAAKFFDLFAFSVLEPEVAP